MKTIFAKSLLALAVVGSMSAQAVTLTAAQKVIEEGLTATNSTTATVNNVTLGSAAGAPYVTTNTAGSNVAPVIATFGAALAANDIVRVTFDVAFATGSSGFTAPSTLTTEDGVTLNLANAGSNFYVYRAGGAVVIGDRIALPGRFTRDGIKANKGLKVSFETEEAAGASIEATDDPVEVLDVIAKRTAKVTQDFAGKIDVSQGRTAFEGSTYKALTTDQTTDATAGVAYDVTYLKQTHVVTGDFSWIKDSNANSSGVQPASGVIDAGACTLEKFEATALTFECGANEDFGLTFDLADNTASTPNANVATVLPATDFTLTSTHDFNAGAVGLASNDNVVFSGEEVGSWSLNGSTVSVPYMVFGTVGGKTFGQVVTVTNNSNVEGTVYVDAWAADGTQLLNNKAMPTKSKAFSSTAYASEILAALGGSYNGRVSLKVTVEAPSSKVQVYAAYTDAATTERAIVVGLKND